MTGAKEARRPGAFFCCFAPSPGAVVEHEGPSAIAGAVRGQEARRPKGVMEHDEILWLDACEDLEDAPGDESTDQGGKPRKLRPVDSVEQYHAAQLSKGDRKGAVGEKLELEAAAAVGQLYAKDTRDGEVVITAGVDNMEEEDSIPPILTAMSINHEYKDAEWYTMMKWLRQYGAAAGSTAAEPPCPTPQEVAASIKLKRHVNCKDPYGPRSPLFFGERWWQYKPVDLTGFLGEWGKDFDRSSPFPLATDVTLEFPSLAKTIHENIPSLHLRTNSKGQVEMVARPSFVPAVLPRSWSYVEHFNLDGRDTTWALRRDSKIGRSLGQCFMTTDNILIFRVWALGLFSDKVDWFCEDHVKLEEGPEGRGIIVRIAARSLALNRQAHIYIVGKYAGPPMPSPN